MLLVLEIFKVLWDVTTESMSFFVRNYHLASVVLVPVTCWNFILKHVDNLFECSAACLWKEEVDEDYSETAEETIDEGYH